jgi:hypothetical protein
MFDGGDRLWPPRTDQEHGLTEASLGKIVGDLTEKRLGRRVTIHLVRDGVATKIVETDRTTGAVRAAATLGHKGEQVTSVFYVHSEGVVCATRWQGAMETGAVRESLAI